YSLSATVATPYNIDYTGDSAIFLTSKSRLFYSKNNGASFSTISSFTTVPSNSNYLNHNFTCLSFCDKDSGVIGGYIGTVPMVQASTGTFNSWNLASPVDATIPNGNVTAVVRFKNNLIYLLDNKGHFYASRNNGTSWQLKHTITGTSGFISNSMSFSDSLNGFFFTNQKVYQTTDGGITLTQVSNLPGGYMTVNKAKFISASTGVVIGSTSTNLYKVFRTIDGGNTWVDLIPGRTTDMYNDLSFPSQDTGFVVGSNYILNTVDGGSTWRIKRFTSRLTRSVDFISGVNGVVGATGTGLVEVWKYNPASPSPYPFALFDFQTNYCCMGQACGVINYGSTAWTYKWYVNNVLAATGHTPPNLIIPFSGNNTIKLVTSDGIFKDSVSTTVYSAAPYTGSTPLNYTVPDSTRCQLTLATFNLLNSNNQFVYYLSSGGSAISTNYQGNGSGIPIYSFPLSAADTIITLVASTAYAGCPGNTFTSAKNFTIFPLPPNYLLSAVDDSICKYDTAKVIIGPLTAGTSYMLYLGSFLSQTTAGLTGQYNVLDLGTAYMSLSPYYVSTDANGCSSTPSVPVHIKVDSTWAKLYTTFPANLIGDTLQVINQSVATQYIWSFSSGTQVISNNNQQLELKYNVAGEYHINLYTTNNTGCKDTLDYKISVFEPLSQGGGSLCLIDSTLMLQDSVYINNWMDVILHFKLHADVYGNTYIARNNYYSSTPDPYYGKLGFKIAKYDVGGTFKWAIGPNFNGLTIGPGWNYMHSSINSISSDPYGNIYFGGNFGGNLLQIGAKSVSFTGTGSNSYIAKLDSNGICQWIIGINSNPPGSGPPPSSVGDIIYDNQVLYTKIITAESIIFSDTILNTGYSSGHFLLKFDADGNYRLLQRICNDFQWAEFNYIDLSGPSAIQCYSYGQKIIKYRDKLIHICMTQTPSISLSPTLGVGNDSSNIYTYAIVTDTLGNVLSCFRPMRIYGIPPFQMAYKNNWEFVPHFSIDKAGYLYFTWNKIENESAYYSASGYNNYGYRFRLSDNTVINARDAMSVLVKYDLSGNVIWYNTHDYFTTSSLVANNDGNIYGIGTAYNLAGLSSIDNHGQLITFPDSCRHALLYSYDNAGNLLWVKPFNSPYFEYPKELSLGDSCNSTLYFACGFDTSASFMGTTISDNDRINIFKLDPSGTCSSITCPYNVTNIHEEETPKGQSALFDIFPNPSTGSFILNSLVKSDINYSITNGLGHEILKFGTTAVISKEINLQELSNGLYFITAVSGGQIQKKKIVITRE
ncbi:MAG: T9SS type A sorting domain-containing protein, partial [Bacteroidia bacterium]